MKIIDSIKSSTGPKRKTFPAAVRELAGKDKEGKVLIYEKAGIKGKYLDEVPILDALDIAGDIERALSEEHGGGEYQLSLVKRDSELVEKFSFSIAGAPKGRRTSANRELQQKEKTSASDERFFRVLDKLADAAMGGRSTSAEDFERVLLLAKELRGDGGMEKEMLVVLLNNLVESKGGNDLDTALGILEISQRIQPQLQREDPFTSLANTVIPIIGQVIAAKQGVPTAGLDQNLMQQIKEALAQFQGSSTASPGAGLPPPGSSEARAPGALAGAPATAEEQPAEAPTPPVAGSQEYFQARFVDPFRRDVAVGQSDDELAYQIVSMTQYARDRMANNLPPLVADFVTATDLAAHGVALAKFFAAIPELANLTQKCESIKNCLIRMFAPGPDEAAPVEEPAIVQDDDTIIVREGEAAPGAADEDQEEQAAMAAESTQVQ